MAPADFMDDSHLRMLASLARTLATSSQDIQTEKTAGVHKPSIFLALTLLKSTCYELTAGACLEISSVPAGFS
jgi:hypothetical protein